MGALLRLAWIELKLFMREPTTIVFTFAFPIVLLFVLGEIFGAQSERTGEHIFGDWGAMNYYVPAYFAVVTMSVGLIMLPTRLTAYRTGGVLRRFRASLVPVWAVLGSQVLAALVLGGVGAVLVWVCADLVYDVRVPASVGAVVLGFLLSSSAFAAVGALLGAVMPSTRAAQGAGLMLFFVMLFLSGAGPPTEVMSERMRRIGDFLPLTYAIDAMQQGWNGGGWDEVALLVLAALTIAVGWLALRVYRWG